MILITGAAGYIGGSVAYHYHCMGKSSEVILLDKEPIITNYGNSIECICDMTDAQSLENVFASYNITAVFHLAAYSIVSESMTNPLKYYHNNLTSTLNLLNCMVKYDTPHLVFSSTCAVYGNPSNSSPSSSNFIERNSTNSRDSGAVDEDTAFDPISHYGKSKLMVEQIIKASPIKSVILRYFNAAGFYGVRECHHPETHLIPIAMASTVSNPLIIMGTDYPTLDGTCIRDYVHVQDIAIAHEKSLNYLETHQTSNTFNLGGKCSGYSVLEIAESIGCPYTTGPRREGDPACLFNRSTKAENILDWHPHNSTIENIIKSIRSSI